MAVIRVEYGLTIENQKLIIEKAKHKKDGCYIFRGVAYKVVNGKVTHYASKGQVLESAYGFNVIIGECPLGSDGALAFIKKTFK